MKNVGRAGEESWPSKVTGRQLLAGDSLQITVPNSGGFGDPHKRDPLKVARGRAGRLHDRRGGRP